LGASYPYQHQGMLLPPQFGHHNTVGGLPGAGGTLRGLQTLSRQPGVDAAAVST